MASFPCTLHFQESSTIYCALEPSTVENIFSTVFLIISVAISILGSYFMRRLNMHRLSSKKEENMNLPVTHMTSWLPLASILTYAYNTYKIPGGVYGFVMAIAGGLSVTYSFFVNLYILPGFIESRDGCNFDYGTVTSQMAGKPSVPSSTLVALNTVRKAQWYGITNGGVAGIYDKVNQTSLNFRPFDNDILGRWDCIEFALEPSTQIILPTGPFDNTTASAIEAILLRENPNFLFTNATGLFSWAQNSVQHRLAGALVWSANEDDDSNESWTLRASVFNGLAANATGAIVTNVECQLNWNSTLWEPPIMPSGQTLIEWTAYTYGILQSYPSDGFAYALGLTLDAMTMVSGTFGSDLWSLQDEFRQTYGCDRPGTAIQYPIWILLSLMLLILIPMSLIDISIIIGDFIRRGKDGLKNQVILGHGSPSAIDKIHNFIKYGKKGLTTPARLIQEAPSGVEGWQLALIKENPIFNDCDTKQIKDFSYGFNVEKGTWEFNRTASFKNRVMGFSRIPPDLSMISTAYDGDRSEARQEVENSSLLTKVIEMHEL